jgi:hypothetical protein
VNSTDFSGSKMISILKQDFASAIERAYTLASAVAALEGRSDVDYIESVLAASVSALSAQLKSTSQHNVVAFKKPESRGPEGGARELGGPASPQELILATLRDHEATVKELQNVLEDHGLEVSPGNLSVILSRMNQSGAIQRTGRGLYSYAG